MNGISVVVPVYNSQESLEELYQCLVVCLSNCTKEFEILLINDFSKDSSGKIIDALSKKDKRVKGIHLAYNCGQHNALLCGIRFRAEDRILPHNIRVEHERAVVESFEEKPFEASHARERDIPLPEFKRLR